MTAGPLRACRAVVPGLVMVAALGAAAAARGQGVRLELIAPAATEPAISGWTASHAAALETGGGDLRGRLLVYLHGQGGTGNGARDLLRTAAEEGFHAVGLTYPNDVSPFNACGGDRACPENLRREILDGVDRTSAVSIPRADSIENRLIKLLMHLDALHPGEAWGDYLDAQGNIRWDHVVLWGHSQGGGNAGVIAKHHQVARVCFSAPAADGGAGGPAAWWGQPYATPASSAYGFCHAQDALSQKVAFWNALGLGQFGGVVDVAASSPPYGGTHQLSSSVEPALAGQQHNSVVSDAATPRNADGTPVYAPVWRHMLTAEPAAPSGSPSLDDVLIATMPGDDGVGVEVRMDVLGARSGSGPRPCVLWIHGGGWMSGTHNQVPAFVSELRDRGISVATIGYRLSGRAVFPAQMHDCKGAVRWLRANAAALNLDPARIGVMGSSAGGHLTALLALSAGVPELEGTTGGNLSESSGVMAAAPLFGPTDLLVMQADCVSQPGGCSSNHDLPASAESALLGVGGAGQGLGWLRDNLDNPLAPFPELALRARLSNPLAFADRTDPPLFAGHGDIDRVVPLGQSLRLVDAMREAGAVQRFVLAPGFGHGALGDQVNGELAGWMGDILLGELVCPRAPAISGPTSVCAGCAATLLVAAQATPPVSYQWRRDGLPLSGANAATFAIAAATAADVGAYDCVIGNRCGEVVSPGLSLVLTPACRADFDGSGERDVADVFAFLSAWFSNDARSDFDDSGVRDVSDVFAFLSAWFAGCP